MIPNMELRPKRANRIMWLCGPNKRPNKQTWKQIPTTDYSDLIKIRSFAPIWYLQVNIWARLHRRSCQVTFLSVWRLWNLWNAWLKHSHKHIWFLYCKNIYDRAYPNAKKYWHSIILLCLFYISWHLHSKGLLWRWVYFELAVKVHWVFTWSDLLRRPQIFMQAGIISM